jgi:hypothetical protein
MYSILGRMNAFRGPNQVISRFASMKREDWETRVWEGLRGRPDNFQPVTTGKEGNWLAP